MKKIPVEDIQDGMKLAKPIMGPSGNILVAAGVQLKASLSSRFNSWGIPEVFIESGEESEKSSPENAKTSKVDLGHVFRGKLKNPLMKILHDTILEHQGGANT